MKKLIREPFTNSIGQTINVGEEVLAVTTGYAHNVNTRVAVYAGFVTTGTSKSVTVMMYEPTTKWRHVETGIEVPNYYSDKRIKDYAYPKWADYAALAPAGTPEYKEAMDKYRAAGVARQDFISKIKDEYESFKVPHWRRSTLQLNRIFKIENSLSIAALKSLKLPTS
jgi:hypothetical protein